MQIIINVCSAL